MDNQEAEQCAIEIVRSILDRQASYKLIVKAVEDQIPPELVAAMGLCGWNALGIFEIVLRELKRAKQPICCPHCVIGCTACGRRWLNG